MDTLLGKNLTQLQEVALQVGLPRFAGKQIAEWLYRKRVTAIDQMTNISLAGRQALKARYDLGRTMPVREAVSVDGTKKYLFAVKDQFIETVFIPDADRATLCLSTQAGCKMHCSFCMTGTLGFHGQLTAADILNQVFSIQDADRLTNIVFMGEGEPMDNIDAVLDAIQCLTSDWGTAWSPHRITVSTVGFLPNIKRFLDECQCHLAISLHNPFPRERADMMPIEKAYPIEEVIALLEQYNWQHQRRLSFEYICFDHLNDTPRHAKQLTHLLRNLNCRINLIRFHKTDNSALQSSETQMEWLAQYLNLHGITTTIRRSRGEDIMAACGMLVNSLQQ